jgi:hypothetical protein
MAHFFFFFFVFFSFFSSFSFFFSYSSSSSSFESHCPSLPPQGGKAGGYFAKDLTTVNVNSKEELLKVLHKGNLSRRQVGEEEKGLDPAKASCIFSITVESAKNDGSAMHLGRLVFVDMAGAEKGPKGAKPNVAIAALKNVISALVDSAAKGGDIVDKAVLSSKKDSKLTKIVSDALGGTSATVVVVNVLPEAEQYDETLKALQLANRAKNVRSSGSKGGQQKNATDSKNSMLTAFQDEISRLEKQLADKQSKVRIQEVDVSAAQKENLERSEEAKKVEIKVCIP